MKEYHTEFQNKDDSDYCLPRDAEGTGHDFVVPAKGTFTFKTTDRTHYLAPYERIRIQNGRCRIMTKQKNFKDPFENSLTRCELLNFGGFQFLEVLFVSGSESYHLVKGIPIVVELQPGTFLEKYKSVTIQEPFNKQVLSREYPGQLEVVQTQNIQYETRDDTEIEKIIERRKEEKNKIRV